MKICAQCIEFAASIGDLNSLVMELESRLEYYEKAYKEADQSFIERGYKILALEARVAELCKLTSHGNGKILMNWMDAHGKAMDRLKNAEKRLIETHARLLDAYRHGYKDGGTAVNTIGPNALQDTEFHLNKYLEDSHE